MYSSRIRLQKCTLLLIISLNINSSSNSNSNNSSLTLSLLLRRFSPLNVSIVIFTFVNINQKHQLNICICFQRHHSSVKFKLQILISRKERQLWLIKFLHKRCLRILDITPMNSPIKSSVNRTIYAQQQQE